MLHILLYVLEVVVSELVRGLVGEPGSLHVDALCAAGELLVLPAPGHDGHGLGDGVHHGHGQGLGNEGGLGARAAAAGGAGAAARGGGDGLRDGGGDGGEVATVEVIDGRGASAAAAEPAAVAEPAALTAAGVVGVGGDGGH